MSSTAGKLTLGSHSESFTDSRMYFQKLTVPDDGLWKFATANISGSSGQTVSFVVAVYNDDSGSIGSFSGSTTEQCDVSTTGTGNAISGSAVIDDLYFPAADYWIGLSIYADGSTNSTLWSDSTPSAAQYVVSDFGAQPDPVGTTTATDGPLDLYITYDVYTPHVRSTPVIDSAVAATDTVTVSWHGTEPGANLPDGPLTWSLERDGVEIASITDGSTTFEDTGLDLDTTYTYRVRIQNNVGWSDYSDEVEATTASPFDVYPEGIYYWNGTDWIAAEEVIEWGDIGGTLVDQTDLQTALDAKYSTSNPSGYITAISGDSTPTLSGNLDMNGYEILFDDDGVIDFNSGDLTLTKTGTRLEIAGTTGTVLRVPSIGGFEIGSDTAITRTGAGMISASGVSIPTVSSTSALTNKDLTSGTNTFPTFNQNTSGSAATLTTSRNIDGQAFNGSADITVIAPGTHAATGKTTPVDADELPLVDSAASNVLKKLTWANLKATLKTYFDTLYQAAGTYLTPTSTSTLTNKRVTKRTGTTTSSATPTINTDNVDFYSLTAQSADITSFTTNLSGTPTEAQTLWIAITGTAARAITWGTSFEASTVALPTTTVTTARLDVGFVWNSVTSKWRCVAVA